MTREQRQGTGTYKRNQVARVVELRHRHGIHDVVVGRDLIEPLPPAWDGIICSMRANAMQNTMKPIDTEKGSFVGAS